MLILKANLNFNVLVQAKTLQTTIKRNKFRLCNRTVLYVHMQTTTNVAVWQRNEWPAKFLERQNRLHNQNPAKVTKLASNVTTACKSRFYDFGQIEFQSTLLQRRSSVYNGVITFCVNYTTEKTGPSTRNWCRGLTWNVKWLTRLAPNHVSISSTVPRKGIFTRTNNVDLCCTMWTVIGTNKHKITVRRTL